ncbi:MAG: hypothetical protein EOM21_19770 [Gammaproteobacteria bacterium]|nr:hypothetical protein [Gammaproteobacteria bacterium]
MLTKADFQRSIADTIDRYPDLAARYRASDPIILQHLEAIATMLAMLSQSLDVAQSEVFTKARDTTVLADAAMRGIVPKARPARIEITVKNTSTTPARIETGRALQDARGRPWVVVAGDNIIPAGAEATIHAEQRTRVQLDYTVVRDEPFHAVEVPALSGDGQRLAGLSVLDDDGEWAYAERYTNVAAGDRVYHVEADERQRLYVRFGLRHVVGTQPRVGDRLSIRLDYSYGDVTPALDSTLALTSVQAPNDAFLTFKMTAMAIAGQDPIAIDALSTLARYPSVYNHDAVYLGEFDFLIRRKFPDLQFLSVWNERIEELARGASVDNINVLFVACLGADDTEEMATSSPGTVIEHQNLTALQIAIGEAIARADDSYRVRFLTPVRAPQTWRIFAMIGSAYLPSVIEQRIREVILGKYGASAMRRGGANFALQDIYASLRAVIPEIAEPGADIAVQISGPDFDAEPLCGSAHGVFDDPPETWRYVAPDTLDVTVCSMGATPPAWGW